MMPAQAWLPEKHLTNPKLAASFAAIVEAWSAHWFAGPSWSAGDRWMPAGHPAAHEEKVFETENGLACSIAGRDRLALAGAMLGLPLDKGIPAKADAQLVTAIADKALSDLADRLSALPFAAPQADRSFYAAMERPQYELKIGPKAKQAIMSFHADRALLVEVARSLAPPPRAQAMPVRRGESIEDKPLDIGAKIGSARLTLVELQGLSVGDVIAFDRPVQSAFALTVNGVATPSSAVLVKTGADGLQLQLTRPLS